jgi:subtilisin family serine protease
MAAPVTAGVAALIRAYYPSFSAAQVKSILCESAVPVKKKVIVPGTSKTKTHLSELCVTGGLVNAYQAVQLAEQRLKTAKY